VNDATAVGAHPVGCEQCRARRGKRQPANDVPSVLLPGVEVPCGAGPQGRFGLGRRARSGEIPIQIAPRDIAFCAKQSGAVPGVAHRIEDPAHEKFHLRRIAALQAIRQRIYSGPTGTTDERIAAIAEQAAGFLYYVSLKGITGAGHLDVAAVASRLPVIRRYTGLPVAVGFGIRDAASAQAVAGVADAVVIGSRIIQEMEAAPHGRELQAAERFVGDIRIALDNPQVVRAA